MGLKEFLFPSAKRERVRREIAGKAESIRTGANSNTSLKASGRRAITGMLEGEINDLYKAEQRNAVGHLSDYRNGVLAYLEQTYKAGEIGAVAKALERLANGDVLAKSFKRQGYDTQRTIEHEHEVGMVTATRSSEATRFDSDAMLDTGRRLVDLVRRAYASAENEVAFGRKGSESYLANLSLGKKLYSLMDSMADYLVKSRGGYSGLTERDREALGEFKDLVKGSEPPKSLKVLAFAGILGGLAGGIFFTSSNITGNVIANISSTTSSFIGSALLTLGIMAGFFWVKLKRK